MPNRSEPNRKISDMTDEVFKLTGEQLVSMLDFVKLHATAFTRREITGDPAQRT